MGTNFRGTPLATADGKAPTILSPSEELAIGAFYDRSRSKHVVRWTAEGKRRTKRFDDETQAEQFSRGLASLVYPDEAFRLGQLGIRQATPSHYLAPSGKLECPRGEYLMCATKRDLVGVVVLGRPSVAVLDVDGRNLGVVGTVNDE